MRIVAIVLLGLALLAGGARAQQAGAGWLGVELKDLTKEEADALGWEAPRGAKLVKPVPGGPAEAEGLKPDDILVSLDGVEIENVKALVETVRKKAAGTEIKLAILRAGREKRLALKLGARPAQFAAAKPPADAPLPMLDTGGHMALIRSIAFTPDGRQLVSASERQDHPRVGSGERQDRAHDQGRERAGRCGQGLRHGAVAGRQVAGGGGVDGQVHGIHSLLRGYPPLRVRERQAHGAVEGACGVAVNGLAFSPDGSTLISGSDDKHRHPLGHRMLCRPDVGGGPKLLHRLEGHKDCNLRRWLQPRWQPRGDGLLRP